MISSIINRQRAKLKSDIVYRWFIFVLLISLILRIIYILRPTAIWWDASIYIGMGKWLFSDQMFGYFEPFRPLLWPFVQGIVWKLNLNPLLWGSIFEVIFAIAVLSVIYLIGEKMRRGAGLIAASLMSFTPFFFGFTNVGITDIPSIFFILLSFHLLTIKKPVLSGFMASIAFLLRFPHVLFVIATFVFLIIEYIAERDVRGSLKKIFHFSGGFLILVVPFLISNYFLYGDILFPLKTGVTLVAYDPILEHQYFYYVINLFKANPFLVFSLLFIYPFFTKYGREAIKNNKEVVGIFLISLLYIGYFTNTAHKEVRYAIGFLPFIALLASVGILNLKMSRRAVAAIVAGGCAVLFMVNVFQIINMKPLETERRDFYEFFLDKTGSTLITSSPMIISLADVKLLGVFDAWENALNSYAASKEEIDFAALDTCGLSCKDKDCESKNALLGHLEAEATLEFERKVGNCELMIYKVKK